MAIKGIMIDCSRLMERHEYYFALVDLMAQWRLNTLVFHFADDFGCGVVLPGYEHLAMPHAFTARELKRLIRYASDRGIEVIPELQAFGHTRYITDHPKYRKLFAGSKTKDLEFNAIDPVNPEVRDLMKGLVAATAGLFPSSYLHVGCEEVNLKEYCEKRGLDVAATWTGYVNWLVEEVRRNGKIPMLWGQHPSKSPEIAAALRKDVVLTPWAYYGHPVTDEPVRILKKAGFKKLILAPALACYNTQGLPTHHTLTNLENTIRYAKQHRAQGIINTIWCPWRYFQGTMHYGVAYTGARLAAGARFNRAAFHRAYAAKTFGLRLTAELSRFLEKMPDMHISRTIYIKIQGKSNEYWPALLLELAIVNKTGLELMSLAVEVAPKKNKDIWNAMVLAVKAVWLCSEAVLIKVEKTDAARLARFKKLLRETRKEAAADWDRTRFADDPQKKRPMFPNLADQYMLYVLNGLDVKPESTSGKTKEELDW